MTNTTTANTTTEHDGVTDITEQLQGIGLNTTENDSTKEQEQQQQQQQHVANNDDDDDDDDDEDSNRALRTFARWIQGDGDGENAKDSYRCCNILVLTGAGISCSAGSKYTIYIYYLFILLFYSNLFSFLFFFSR